LTRGGQQRVMGGAEEGRTHSHVGSLREDDSWGARRVALNPRFGMSLGAASCQL
jgi:hypothetical protein